MCFRIFYDHGDIVSVYLFQSGVNSNCKSVGKLSCLRYSAMYTRIALSSGVSLWTLCKEYLLNRWDRFSLHSLDNGRFNLWAYCFSLSYSLSNQTYSVRTVCFRFVNKIIAYWRDTTVSIFLILICCYILDFLSQFISWTGTTTLPRCPNYKKLFHQVAVCYTQKGCS